MKKSSCNIDDNVFGISPLGGNSTDGANTEGVPLFWDNRAQAYISEQSIEELNDRDISNMRRSEENKEVEFLTKIGYRKG